MLEIYYRSTIGVLKIAIAIVIVGCHIPIVNDSDSIGHPCWWVVACMVGGYFHDRWMCACMTGSCLHDRWLLA